MQWLHSFTAIVPRGGLKFLHRLPHLECGRACRHRRPEAHRDGMGNAMGQFPDEPPLFEAEQTAPHPVERDWHDGRVHVFHNALQPAPERKQLADACDLSLGKDAHDMPFLDRVAGGLQRLEQVAGPLFGRNGNHAQRAGKRFYVRQLVNALEHHEPHMPVRRGDEQQRIDERNVVAYEQRAALCGNVVAAIHPHAINRVGGDPQKETQKGAGQQPEAVKRSTEREQGGHHKNLARTQVQHAAQQIENARRDKDADERQ